MERAATTASSLEAEQDSGNINRTQSMATLNEPLPQGTSSGSDPRCQVTILGGAEAQTRTSATKPFELLHDRKPVLSYLYVFGALCYPTNDGEDLGKLKPKADIGIFIGYAPARKHSEIYIKKSRMIIEILFFDELTTLASEQLHASGPVPKLLTPETISSGLVPNIPSSTSYVLPTKNDWEILFQPMFDEYLIPPPSVDL
ncbi:hypothetical protein Tco_0641615 [Tanacetum coccineum]